MHNNKKSSNLQYNNAIAFNTNKNFVYTHYYRKIYSNNINNNNEKNKRINHPQFVPNLFSSTYHDDYHQLENNFSKFQSFNKNKQKFLPTYHHGLVDYKKRFEKVK